MEFLDMLINAGANLDQGDLYEETPLHYAARLGKTEFITRLCEARANVNAK